MLSDRVFTQSPRTIEKLIAHLVEEPSFQVLTADASFGDIGELALPDTAGAAPLFEAIKQKLDTETDDSARRSLRSIMAVNASATKLKSIWLERFNSGKMICTPLTEAENFGVLGRFTENEVRKITESDIETVSYTHLTLPTTPYV